MEGERRKTTEEEIKEVETLIVNNSKDAHFAKGLIQRLSGLYQMDKLIDVPMKDVKDTIDFGACAIHKVKDGYVFEAKGGLITHISIRMQRVCVMFQTLFDQYNKKNKTEEENIIYDIFSTAIQYLGQCLIFSSLDERALFQNATAILNSYTEYCTENYTNATAPERTEEDIKDDVAFEQAGQAIENLANAPIPPEED